MSLAVKFSEDLLKEQKNKVAAQTKFVKTLLSGGKPQPLPRPKATGIVLTPQAHHDNHLQQTLRPASAATRCTAIRSSYSGASSSSRMASGHVGQMQTIAALIDSKLEARVATLEDKWGANFKRLEERVRALEAGTSAVTVLSDSLALTQADMDKRDARNVALMKKLHAIHAQELEDRAQTLQQDQQQAVESLHEDLRAQSREVIRLRTVLDRDRDATTSRADGGQGAESPLGLLVKELSLRVGKLETRHFVEAAEMSGGAGVGSNNSSQATNNNNVARPSPSRDDALYAASLRDSIAELALQLNDVETDIVQLRGSVKQTAQALLSDRKSRAQEKTRAEHSEQSGELEALHKKLHGVGKHASKAIKGLSEGLTDIQYSILALYSWSNSVNAKLYLPVIDDSKFKPIISSSPRSPEFGLDSQWEGGAREEAQRQTREKERATVAE